jgi:hypothetical protein
MILPDWFENKNVAVVGNAKSQLEKLQGEEIDSHEIVIRFNQNSAMWNKGQFKEYFGEKIDVWALWHCYDWRRFGIPFNGLLLHLGEDHYDKSEGDYIFPLEKFRECQRLLKHIPSSGFLCLYMMAMCNPKQVNIYGFDWKKSPTFTHNSIVTFPHAYDREEAWVRENILIKSNYTLK